jgi:hypothetical protein
VLPTLLGTTRLVLALPCMSAGLKPVIIGSSEPQRDRPDGDRRIDGRPSGVELDEPAWRQGYYERLFDEGRRRVRPEKANIR